MSAKADESSPAASQSSRPPPPKVLRVETRLVDVRSGFMTLELDEGKVLSFPVEDEGTERECQRRLALGEVVVVLEMRDEVPMKILGIGAASPSPRGDALGAMTRFGSPQ